MFALKVTVCFEAYLEETQMKGSSFTRLLPFAFLLLFLPLRLQAQVLSTAASASLNATLPESLTVALTGVSSVSFSLTPGGAVTGDNPVTIETSWVLQPSRTAVKLVGYFDSTNALSDAGPPAANISTSNVLGQVTTGTPTSFTAFTQTISGIGTAGASLELFSETITGANKNKTRADNLNLKIDLTSADQQPAGNYTGTLRIQAIAL